MPPPADVKPFYVTDGNQWDLVASALTARGEAWWRMPFCDKRSNDFFLKWTESVSAIDYSTFKEGEQLVNHIPNNKVISHKKGLLKSLMDHKRDTGLEIEAFLPQTFCFDAIIDRVEWAKVIIRD